MAINHGLILQEKRKAKGLTQLMLAKRTGMSTVQLCKIEKGHTSPTLDTVERIAEALGMSLSQLLVNGEDELDVAAAAVASANADKMDCSRFIAVRVGCDGDAVDLDALKKILQAENAMVELEDKLGIQHSTLLPLIHALQIDTNGAHLVARSLRCTCAATGGSFTDLAEMLAFWNIRIHRVNMERGVQSRLYFDAENRSFSIVLNRRDTPERHVNRIAYELAWAVVFASTGFKPVRETPLRHRFAREFASEFLMPEESVRFAVLQLGVRPSDWTLDMVCSLKSKFNVSAEAFALRLESLGLIAERLRQKIRDELREYYKTHPKAMEPKPCLSPLNLNLRTSLLEMEVERREWKG